MAVITDILVTFQNMYSTCTTRMKYHYLKNTCSFSVLPSIHVIDVLVFHVHVKVQNDSTFYMCMVPLLCMVCMYMCVLSIICIFVQWAESVLCKHEATPIIFRDG